MAKQNKFLYPIFKLPNEFKQDLDVREIPVYIKWWLYNSYNKKHSGVLSDILFGSYFHLADSIQRKFNIFTVCGNTEQNGEPSPSNEVPIKNVTGNVNTKIQNKNLFVAQKIVEDSNKNSIYIDDGYIRYITAGERLIMKPDIIKQNTSYTYNLILKSGVNETNEIAWGIVYKDGTVENVPSVVRTNTNEFLMIFSTNSNKTLDYVRSSWLTGKEAFVKINGSMIIEGSYTEQTLPPYVPHQEQNYPFTFAEGQRAMEGTTLQDDGIHQKRKQIVLDGTENWAAFISQGKTSYYMNLPDGTGHEVKCSHFISQISGGFPDENKVIYNGNTNKNILFYRGDTENKLTEWKAWLAEQYANGTPVIVEYKLAEEEIIPYNATQQAEYNAFKTAHTYEDVTYIDSSSDEADPILKIQYYEKEVNA